MKESVEAISEADLYLTGSSHKAIGGKYAERSTRLCEKV